MKIRISICPTNMEIDGDIIDEGALEERIIKALRADYPDANIEFQVGYSQGDEWFQMDGEDSDEVRDIVMGLDWCDESLYEDADE